MAGGHHTHKPSDSSFPSDHHHNHHRKSRWESSSSSAPSAQKPRPSPNNKIQETPIPKPNSRPENPSPRPLYPPPPIHHHEPPPPLPPPSYGFHMLERRSMLLADGSVRSYFALPPDYDNFKPGFRPEFPFGPPFPVSPDVMARDARPPQQQQRNPNPNPAEYWNSWKRKMGEDERDMGKDDGLDRQRQQLLQYGNANGPGSRGGEDMRPSKSMRIHEGSSSNLSSKLKHNEVDQTALRKAIFNFVKLLFESPKKTSYLADGKQGPLPCLACKRSSKDFPDAHTLVMHAYSIESADSIVDHLAFHKALCVLMGWNFSMAPDNSKAYQNLSAHEAEANQDDLIMWPPSVLIHNSTTGKGKDGRMEGIGNRAMDAILKDLGYSSGKSMSLYSREGHVGIHAVKFSPDETGLKEALRLAEYFERERRGRKSWAQVQATMHGKEDESNPNLMKLDPKSGEKKRVLYGHLGTAADLDKVTFEIRKKVSIVSIRDVRQSK